MGCGSSSASAYKLTYATPGVAAMQALDSTPGRGRIRTASVASVVPFVSSPDPTAAGGALSPESLRSSTPKRAPLDVTGRRGSVNRVKNARSPAMSTPQARLTRHDRSHSSSNLLAGVGSGFGATGARLRKGSLRVQSVAALATPGSAGRTRDGSSRRRGPAPTLLTMMTEDFDMEKVIGRGGYAHVRAAYHNQSKQWMALKGIKKRYAAARNTIKDLESEQMVAGALNALDHPFLVKYFGSFQDSNTLYFAFELVGGGELFTRLRAERKFPNAVAKFYAAEVLLGIQAMHRAGFAYRDLKPENILIDKDGHVRIVDFGFSKAAGNSERMYRRVGTANYLAPEMLDKDVKHTGYTKVVDWWSFGCLLYEMLTGRTAFGRAGDPSHAIYMQIMKGSFSTPHSLDSQAADLIRHLLNPDLRNRLVDPEAIKGHPWFKNVAWELIIQRRAVPPFKPLLVSPGDLSQFDSYSTSLDKKQEAKIKASGKTGIVHQRDFAAFG